MTFPPPPEPWPPEQSARPATRPGAGTPPIRPAESGWRQLFDEPALFKPAPTRRPRTVAVVGGAVVAAAVIVVVIVWLVWPSPGPSAPTSSSPTTTTPEHLLSSLLPHGYPSGGCSASPPPTGFQATFTCGSNTDPDGPADGTYALAGDKTALAQALDRTSSDGTVVVCPGNIESPGPWRHNTTPDRVSGTLVCAMRGDIPTVAWTTDDARLLSTVSGGPQGPDLAGLYRWWSSHS